MKHLVWHPATQLPGLYAIVDLPDPAGLGAEQLARAMAQAAADCRPRVLQLRAKTLSTQQLRAAVVAVADACRGTGVGVVVNDHVELAVSGIPGVVGVHLGQEDLDALGEPVAAIRQLRAQAARAGHEHFCIGVSTHDLDQVRHSRDLAIDYIGFGPVRRTSSKQLAEPVTGFDTLRDACAIARVPVVAIG
ncbi:MAG: thiamine phosphate synthase, partial [Nannocystaceae bacterium]